MLVEFITFILSVVNHFLPMVVEARIELVMTTPTPRPPTPPAVDAHLSGPTGNDAPLADPAADAPMGRRELRRLPGGISTQQTESVGHLQYLEAAQDSTLRAVRRLTDLVERALSALDPHHATEGPHSDGLTDPDGELV